MSDHLMTSRRFAPLFWTQFLSAFNDNFLKNTLVLLILFTAGVGPGGLAGHACGRDLHGALPAAFGARRRTCRPLRQGADGAAAEIRRDRSSRYCRCGHRAFLNPGDDGGAVRVRRDFGTVRADQIRHPAGSSAEEGTAQGQCLDRGRDLRRDPGRHHRRRHRVGGRHQRRDVRPDDDGSCRRLLADEPRHSRDRLGRARSRHRPQHLPLDLAAGFGTARRPPHLARRADGLLVLDGRRDRPVGAAAAGERRRSAAPRSPSPPTSPSSRSRSPSVRRLPPGCRRAAWCSCRHRSAPR